MDFPTIRNEAQARGESYHDGSNKKDNSKNGTFQALDLIPLIHKGVVKMGYKVPTPIQRKALPMALAGKDVVAMARTGSGKTAAFLIPLLNTLKTHSSINGARGMILSPTRELAQQTYGFAKQLGKFTSMRMCLIIGGDKLEAQFQALHNNPDILIAAPGRLAHLLVEMKNSLVLERVRVLIFDEADRLFEMGFKPQIELILAKIPTCQRMLFSATLPKQLEEFTRAGCGLSNPCYIRLDTDNKLNEELKLAFFKVRTEEKVAALMYLISEVIDEKDQSIIFVATKHHVDYLQRMFQLVLGLEVSVAYSSLDHEARTQNIELFRQKKNRIFLVTDVAARGIDIPLLNNVINFDFPATKTVKLFLHRVGRAARQGRSGTAFSFFTNEEKPFLVDCCLFIGIKLDRYTGSATGAEQGPPRRYSLAMMTPKEIDFGSFPQEALDTMFEKVGRVEAADYDLLSLQKSVRNAHKLYVKTRESASRSSVARAKKLDFSAVHPLLHTSEANTTAATSAQQKDSFTRLLKGYRPKETVFELNEKKLKAGKEGNLEGGSAQYVKGFREEVKFKKLIKAQVEDVVKASMGDGGRSVSNDVLMPSRLFTTVSQPQKQRKRPLSKAERKKLKAGVSMKTIERKRKNQNPASGMPSTYKDTATYITDNHDGNHAQGLLDAALDPLAVGNPRTLQEEIFELLPDDEKEMQSKRKTYHWDKRKKKYIKATAAEHIENKRVRNESGAAIDTKNRGFLYAKWQKKYLNGKALFTGTSDGEQEEEEDGIVYDSVSVRKIAHTIREKTRKAREIETSKSKSKNELVTDESQIRKQLERKEKDKQRNVKGRKKLLKQKKFDQHKEAVKGRIFGSKRRQPSTNRYARSRIIASSQTKQRKQRNQ